MTVDWAVTPGLLLLLAQVVALAAVGYVVARTVLRQDDERLALAQGLVVGLALWGFVVNVVLYVIPAPAGAIASWMLTLTLGVGLAWRARRPLRPSLRTTAGVLVAALALFWVALASRQLLSIVEDFLHLGLAASIRAGGFHPPAFPWSPDLPSAYHYGANLLVALMTPPFGPDLAFVTELLGAYSVDELRPDRGPAPAATGIVDRGAGPRPAVAHGRRVDATALHHAAGHRADSRRWGGPGAQRQRPHVAYAGLLAVDRLSLGARARGVAAEYLETLVHAGVRPDARGVGAGGRRRAAVVAVGGGPGGAGRISGTGRRDGRRDGAGPMGLARGGAVCGGPAARRAAPARSAAGGLRGRRSPPWCWPSAAAPSPAS